MFCPGVKHLVLLCLGADITLLSISSDSDSQAKSNSKTKKECLRVTMVHGDIVVLSGSEFEVRRNAASVIIELIESFWSSLCWFAQACVCVSTDKTVISTLADGPREKVLEAECI